MAGSRPLDWPIRGIAGGFGIKVSGGADWFVAEAAGEASFEIKLTWARWDEPDGAVSEARSPIVGRVGGGFQDAGLTANSC